MDSKDEMVIIEDGNEKDQQEDAPPSDNSSISETMENILRLTTSLFICGLISVFLAILATRFFSSSSTEDLLPKFFISIVCVTWINCSVTPFVLFSAETEVEPSRRYVDTVIRAVVKSVLSYLRLYVPDTGLLSQYKSHYSEKAKDEEKVVADDTSDVHDRESAEVC